MSVSPKIAAVLNDAGIDSSAVEAATRIDALLQNWRRRMSRRELGHSAIKELGIGLDLAQVDVLVAIAAPINEFGETAGAETMVATVAERLSIDPSRASRIVGDMVDSGYAVRVVSQADARRTLIALTPAGQSIVDAVRTYKFLLMGDFLSEWSAEEIAGFVPMLERIADWSATTEERSAKFAVQIESLAQSVRDLELKAPIAIAG